MRCRGSGVSGGLATPGRVTNRAGSGTGWEAGRYRVTAPYAKPGAARVPHPKYRRTRGTRWDSGGTTLQG